MSKKDQKKEKGEKKIYAYYIELESPLDLAREAFGYSSGHIKAQKDGSKYRLLSIGEKMNDIRFIYYVTLDRIGNFFLYNPGSDSNERYEIKDKILSDQMDFKSYKAPIVELMANPYTEAKDIKKAGKVIKIEAKDSDTFIKSLINYSHDDEPPPKLYAFFDGKDHIIGTFDFFHESSMRIFTYAKINIKERFAALTYNYTNDSIEPTNSFTEKSVVYIRVINLKKQFPFF